MNNSSLGSNWEHYLEAFRAYSEWVEHKFPDALRNHEGSNPELYKPLEDISVAEENKRLAVDGYLALYADLLGFSDEIGETGFDPLPDFYGAALVSAANYPLVQVFLLSDSCLAFAPVKEVDSFLDFVFSIFGGWLADGMLPRCIIGYGSFVERRPFREETPPNFFGTQVTGTSLVDAANIEKRRRPLGARILLSDSALEYVPDRFSFARDADGNAELLPVIRLNSLVFTTLCIIFCASELNHQAHAPSIITSGRQRQE